MMNDVAKLILQLIFITFVAFGIRSFAADATPEPDSSEGQPQSAGQFVFADIPWRSNVATVTRLLTARGFEPNAPDKDGDIMFRGQLMGHKIIGLALFTSNGLQKITVTLVTPDNRARPVYRDLRKTLIDKYGPSSKSYEFFQRPYYDGDGYEDQAIRLGKGHFASVWQKQGQVLGLSITERLTVRIAYEGPQWGEAVDQRRSKERSVF
jgi:hypothetical protein